LALHARKPSPTAFQSIASLSYQIFHASSSLCTIWLGQDILTYCFFGEVFGTLIAYEQGNTPG